MTRVTLEDSPYYGTTSSPPWGGPSHQTECRRCGSSLAGRREQVRRETTRGIRYVVEGVPVWLRRPLQGQADGRGRRWLIATEGFRGPARVIVTYRERECRQAEPPGLASRRRDMQACSPGDWHDATRARQDLPPIAKPTAKRPWSEGCSKGAEDVPRNEPRHEVPNWGTDTGPGTEPLGAGPGGTAGAWSPKDRSSAVKQRDIPFAFRRGWSTHALAATTSDRAARSSHR